MQIKWNWRPAPTGSVFQPAAGLEPSGPWSLLRKAVVDVRPQRVGRDPAPMILLDARQLRAAQPAGATNLDPFRTEVLRSLQRLFHCAAERDPPLQLQGDVLGDQLRVRLR